MAVPESLTKSQFVACTVCGVSMTGSEVVDHDASPGHQRRKAEYFMKRAVQKVTGWTCPGPCFPPRGNFLLDR